MGARLLGWSTALAALLIASVLLATGAASATAVSGPALPTHGSTGAGVPLATVTLKTVTVGVDPRVTIYDAANKMVYVSNAGSSFTSAINSTTYAVTKVAGGIPARDLVYDPSDKDVYVENLSSISILSSANKLVKTVVFAGTYLLFETYDPANGDVYALASANTTYKMFDINHSTFTTKAIVLPEESLEATYDNASASLVVSSPAENELTAINATDHATTIKLTVGLTPETMVYDPNNKYLYVSDLGEVGSTFTKTGNVTVLSSANKIVKTIKVGKFPTYGAYDPKSHDIFEVNTVGVAVKGVYPNGTVSIINNTNVVIKTLTLGRFSVGATYDPKNQEMYITATASNRTYAINSTTNTIAAKIVTGQNPEGAGYDGKLGEMLVPGDTEFWGTSTAKTTVTLLPSANSPTSTISLGTGPFGDAVWDPVDSAFFAANGGTDTVTVIL
jgi:YVTN family beta-propeller protein